MAAGAWVFTNNTRTQILNGTLLSGGSYKVALFTSSATLAATSDTYANLTNEVGTTNTGYSTGGAAVTLSLTGTTSVTVTFATNPVWTAGSANLVAKWGVLYKVGSYIYAYHTLDSGGADVTTTSGNTLTIDSDGTPGPVLTFA